MNASQIRVWMEHVRMETMRTLAPAMINTWEQTAQVSLRVLFS